MKNLGFNNVQEVRAGKHITMQIEAETENEARQISEEVCRKVLANPVMEYYEIEMIN